ncbi:unnamed protein product [Nippostrongylus brasiliensis]|uniref:Leptin receptor n=1 Tax=Nippostrongylus brasiliensis TaxID=27835 RepID=A0A0N4XNS0_NIPBR|nr:unnamed protein product [Nippostrongylus brasiliensis]
MLTEKIFIFLWIWLSSLDLLGGTFVSYHCTTHSIT